MSPTPHRFDWKLIALVLALCYFIPGVVVGALLAAGVLEAAAPYVGQAFSAFLAFFCFLLPPVAGGYVTARRARALPWRHVFVVGAIGAVLSLLAFRASPRAMVAYMVASVVLAAFGGYIRLGKR